MKKWIYRILIVVFALAFAVSAFLLIRYFVASRKEAKVYDELASIVETARENALKAQPVTPGNPEEPVSPWVEVTHPETGQPVQVLPEYAELFTMNPDLVGWIQLPGTKLDYPVMQTPQEPNYYLKRNFHREKSSHGCIYVQEDCNVFTPSENLTIYGHRMRDGSMFYPLESYKKQAFYEDHRIIRFDTIRERHQYEIFAVFLTSATKGKGFAYNTFVDGADQTDFDNFVARCKKLSLYDTGITPTYGDKLITLSTCEYSQNNGRLVVVARRID